MRINSNSNVDQLQQNTETAKVAPQTAKATEQSAYQAPVASTSNGSASIRKSEMGIGSNLKASQLRQNADQLSTKSNIKDTQLRPGTADRGKPGSGGGLPPTSLVVKGTKQFVAQVAADLAKFAPGTTIDANGYVRAATTQVAGHASGYQLINNLLGSDKTVTIQFVNDNAYTQSGTGATGTPQNPSTGSAATVAYDPTWSSTIALPTRQADGSIKDQPVASAVVLAHELIHATHAQQGTIDRSLVNHTFTENGTTYTENWRFEEFRTTGLGGFNVGNEPTENSIRAELGFMPRATYLFRDSWQSGDAVKANGSTDTSGFVPKPDPTKNGICSCGPCDTQAKPAANA